MIKGIGIDLIEIERISKLLERKENKFLQKIFTYQELKNLPNNQKRMAEYVAGRFAAKEAVAKALGTGIGKDLNWKDIEILVLDNGKPYISLKENKNEKKLIIHLSISHTRKLAIAKVIIEQK